MDTNGRSAVCALVLVAIGVAGCAGSQAPTPLPSAAAATGGPSPSSIPDLSLSQSFSSTLNGISLSHPEGWSAQPATELWTAGTFPLSFPGAQVDWLHDPTLRSELFLAIASQPIGDATPEAWVATQMASDEGCGTATESVAVDGGSGVIGTDCSVAVVTSGDRGYWIQLYTGDDAPATYDMAWFEEVLASVRLLPSDAVDQGSSPSP